jgi:flagellar biosynthesis protein FlhB
MSSEGSRTEPATPRRRQKARERGQVARSVELVSAFLLFTVLLLLFLLERHTGGLFRAYFRDTAGKADQIEISMATLPSLIRENIYATLWILAPYLMACVVVVLLIDVMQVGLVLSTQALNPDFNRINPLNGFKRLFSTRSIVELLKNLLKLFIVAAVSFSILASAAPGLISSMSMAPEDGIRLALATALRIALFSCALLLVIAILDYIYQRMEFEKSIRMSKEEIKEEYKMMEGDPQVKRRIREMGRKIVMSRMFEALKSADAVITNPTHFAVALRYEVEWHAPKVVAKGKDYAAKRIIRYATEMNLPVYEQPSLARALYEVPLDDFVPAALFKAVARVIAYLSRHDERLRRKLRGLRPGPQRR